MPKERTKVRFDKRIFSERSRNQLPPQQENPLDQMRALSQWLLVVPIIMAVIFGCGQLALFSNTRLAFADSPSSLAAAYDQWAYLPVLAVRDDIIAEIRSDFEGLIEIRETFEQPENKPEFAWVPEDQSPVLVAALPTILPHSPTNVPLPAEQAQESFVTDPVSFPTQPDTANNAFEAPVANTSIPTYPPSATDPPSPTQPGPQPTDTPQPTNTISPSGTPSQDPTSTPTTTPAPTSVPTSTPTTTAPLPTSTLMPSATPTAMPTATATPGDTVGWWNGCYQYRQQVTVRTAGSGVNEAYSAFIIFNHRGLVSSGKSRSDGGDIRILWNSGSNWYELDRVVGNNSSWNRSNTVVFFQLAAGMGAYSSNSNYYLYYGCSSASNPPDDPNNVYWYFNNFNTDNALNGWTQRDVEDVGDWRVINGHLELESSGRQADQLPNINHKLVLTGRPVIQNLLVKFEFLMRDDDLIAVGLCSNDNSPTGFYVGYSKDRWFDDDGVPDRTGYWSGATNTGYSPTNLNLDTVYRTTVAWTSNRIANSFNGMSYLWNTGPSSANYFCFAANSMDAALDDLIIRNFVNPEPVLSLGGEQTP